MNRKRILALLFLALALATAFPASSAVETRVSDAEPVDTLPRDGKGRYDVREGNVALLDDTGAEVAEWPIPEGLFVKAVAPTDDALALMATTYETLAESGPYSVYWLDRISGETRMSDMENCVTLVCKAPGNAIYAYKDNQYIWRVSAKSGMERLVASTSDKLYAMAAHGEHCVYLLNEKGWVVENAVTSGFRILHEAAGIACEGLYPQEDGSVVYWDRQDGWKRLTIENRGTTDFFLNVPEEWRDARMEAAIENFEALFPEYRAVYQAETDDPEPCDIEASRCETPYSDGRGLTEYPYDGTFVTTGELYEKAVPLKGLLCQDAYATTFRQAADEDQFVDMDAEYLGVPVQLGVYMLKPDADWPTGVSYPKAGATWEEFYAWAHEAKAKTGRAAFADDPFAPMAIRAYIDSFPNLPHADFLSEEFVS